MDNGDPFTVFFEDFGFSESKIFFGQGKCSTAGRLAGWLASQQKVPPSPGLIIISIIIIVMIVKLLIISSISTISFIHICNMNDINNNIVRVYSSSHRGDPPRGAETTETTTETTTTNIPTPTTPLAPAPRDEISRSGHQPPHSDNVISNNLCFEMFLKI